MSVTPELQLAGSIYELSGCGRFSTVAERDALRSQLPVIYLTSGPDSKETIASQAAERNRLVAIRPLTDIGGVVRVAERVPGHPQYSSPGHAASINSGSSTFRNFFSTSARDNVNRTRWLPDARSISR